MSNERSRISTDDDVSIYQERLDDITTLTDFIFRQGGNIYVFSYEKEGTTKHTFVDAGDSRYENEIIAILDKGSINAGNIERIIITHRHPDHYGLAFPLARRSNARIMVHANFRDFIEGNVGQTPGKWTNDHDPSQLRQCDIEYLPPLIGKSMVINGVDFPRLVEPIGIGDKGNIEILASPESRATHSPDQIIVLYSTVDWPHSHEKRQDNHRPTNDILFSGDLWLMRGPLFNPGMRSFTRNIRYGIFQMKNMITGGNTFRRDPREQDAVAKDALKRGFCLIRVKPGHGDEFLGSKVIPNSLMAPRDLLIEFGYSIDDDISLLRSPEMAPKVATRLEDAYSGFIQELGLWQEWGYSQTEIARLLARIYQEQSGGGMLVEKDRKERRKKLKEQLTRMKQDKKVTAELHQVAALSLSALKNTS